MITAERYPVGVETPWDRSGIMRVVLHYQGPMGKGDKNDLMHGIRCQLHPQLKRLWDTDQSLQDVASEIHVRCEGKYAGFARNEEGRGWIAYPVGGHSVGEFKDANAAGLHVIHRFHGVTGVSRVPNGGFVIQPVDNDLVDWTNALLYPGIEFITDDFTREPFRFVPLVTKRLHLMCHLSIRLYRQGDPGSIVGNKGDLDNKLKRIIDALRVPGVDQLKPGKGDPYKPDDSQAPFYCLLEDDALVSGIEIRTERWFPTDPGEVTEHEVKAVIEAVVRPTKVTDTNRGLLADYL